MNKTYRTVFKLLRIGNSGISRRKFMQQVADLIPVLCECDAVEFWISEDNVLFRWIIGIQPYRSFRMRTERLPIIQQPSEAFDQEAIAGHMFINRTPSSLLIPDTKEEIELDFLGRCGRIGGNFTSLHFSTFDIDGINRGLMILKKKNSGEIGNLDEILLFSETMGLAVSDRRTQYALRERVKELSCLYNISQIAQMTHMPLPEMFQSIVRTMPPAWQYPELAAARIVYDGSSYTTEGFRENERMLSAPIVIYGEIKGSIDIVYTDTRVDMEENWFLSEEEHLIDAIASHVDMIVEKTIMLLEQKQIQEQLRHADRLATIGELSAGIAHELNEPLAAILGFAQLIKSDEDMSETGREDLIKIIKSAIHARDIVRNLLLFAREVPEENSSIDINQVIEDGLFFTEARCQKENIEMVKRLVENIPGVIIDPGQLHQILTNLVINSIQAMDHGGRIEIRTFSDGESVYLEIEDNGRGIPESVRDKIFLPFFTTKDTGQGTGLGLSVVYGIITAASGQITVDSAPGRGTVFRIKLPAESRE